MSLEINQVIFQSPFTGAVAGPTRAGKSTLLFKILKQSAQLINPPPQRIVYCYSTEKPNIDNVNIEFINGMPDLDDFDAKINNLLILDDLMDACEKDCSISKLFTVESHHKNISTIFITQNIFSRGKYARTISLNCHYLILFNNPRDRSQVSFLARQMYPSNPKFLVECFEDATENTKHGYLFIDLTQSTNKDLRVQTNILLNQTRIIYKPK